MQLLNGILGPVVGATGSDWKDHEVSGPEPKARKSKPERPKPQKKSSPHHRVFRMSDAGSDEEKEAALLAAFRTVGGRRGAPSKR